MSLRMFFFFFEVSLPRAGTRRVVVPHDAAPQNNQEFCSVGMPAGFTWTMILLAQLILTPPLSCSTRGHCSISVD